MEKGKVSYKPKTTVIVPAYNEENGISIILEQLKKIIGNDPDCEIIVVDDGSSDATSAIAGKYGYKVIRHVVNKGKGEALKTGITNATAEKLVWIDADNSYPAELIPQVIKSLDSYDIVVCSRRYGQENIPAFNRIGNYIFRTLIRGFYGFKPYDPCSGLFGAHKSQLAKMDIVAHRFSIEPEIAIKAGRMKLKMLDIPITYRKRIGQTKLNSIKVGFEDMWAIMKFTFWMPKTGKHGK